MNWHPPPCARCRMERGKAASSGKVGGLLHCTLRHLCEVASDLDSRGFRHLSKFVAEIHPQIPHGGISKKLNVLRYCGTVRPKTLESAR